MQVSLENGPVIQMKPVVGSQAADFYGVFRGEIVLKNNARSVVPVKLSLAEVSQTLPYFCFANLSPMI